MYSPDRTLFLLPPCDAEEDGVLSVLGMRQARSLGNALGDEALRAVYAGPGVASEETAGGVAQRHGLAVRPRPPMFIDPLETFDETAARLIQSFDGLARVGPGRVTVLVAEAEVIGLLVAYCRGSAPVRANIIPVSKGSISEVLTEEKGFTLKRVDDTSHLGVLDR